jgi:hypothetical protein
MFASSVARPTLISPELNSKEAKGGFGYETDLDGAFGK